jgi:DNA-binding transcriptional regulator YiaG
MPEVDYNYELTSYATRWISSDSTRSTVPAEQSSHGFAGEILSDSTITLPPFRLAGTGDSIEPLMPPDDSTGSDFFFLNNPSEYESETGGQYVEHSETEATVYSPSQLLGTIRSSLSLRVTELAEALQVQRPTIYAWMKSETEPQDDNRLRLEVISEIAREWRSLSDKPLGNLLRQPTGDSPSLMNLLKRKHLNQSGISKLLRQLSNALEGQVPKWKRRLTATEQARQRGFDFSTVNENPAEFDVLTGKRSHEE